MQYKREVLVRNQLERLYSALNRREFVAPDPLQFLYSYDLAEDIEVVGLIVSSLAYGRVSQIIHSCKEVLSRLGPSPYNFVKNASTYIDRAFCGFRYRFTTGYEISRFLWAIKGVLDEFGSINNAMLSFLDESGGDMCLATRHFLRLLYKFMGVRKSSLLPSFEGRSANKRINLYLRWMIRRDAVDLGIWQGISPGVLIVPLDTHMLKIGRILGFTKRRTADIQTALEITAGFRRICPHDPVRYDFVLTRFGIRDDMDMSSLSAIFRSD